RHGAVPPRYRMPDPNVEGRTPKDEPEDPFAAPGDEEVPPLPDAPPSAPSSTLNTQHSTLNTLRVLGQAQDLFILAEGDGQLWVIDQHVAHARIFFARLATAAGCVRAAERRLVPPPL